MEFFDELNILLEADDDFEDIDASIEEETEDETSTDENTEEENNDEENSDENNNTDSEEEVDENSEGEETEDEISNEGEENLEDDSMDEEDTNEDDALSEEEKEAKLKRPFYYKSFLEVLNSTKSFLDNLADKSSSVSDEKVKFILKKISNSLFKQKNDLKIILREKILNMSVENLNNLLTMFITKTETLIELTNEIFDELNDNK